MQSLTLIVTGGAGFIGSAVVRLLIRVTPHKVINVDRLTYAGNLNNLDAVANHVRYTFEKVDICNQQVIKRLFSQYSPDGIIHLAAETHVDRSIHDSSPFIETNIVGTSVLLEAAREWCKVNPNFRFLHVSTDEVYGSLREGFFSEAASYQPSSPYSASKASSDHLVQAWFKTHQVPGIITHSSNNYGPCQFPEKLIPLTIQKALSHERIPIYGNGKNVRDWLYVDDHAEALLKVFEQGTPGEIYNIAGLCEKTNVEVVQMVCRILDELKPIQHPVLNRYEELIQFVPDRPGHDFRYAIDSSKIQKMLGWKPMTSFDTGMRKTVEWYLDHL